MSRRYERYGKLCGHTDLFTELLYAIVLCWTHDHVMCWASVIYHAHTLHFSIIDAENMRASRQAFPSLMLATRGRDIIIITNNQSLGRSLLLNLWWLLLMLAEHRCALILFWLLYLRASTTALLGSQILLMCNDAIIRYYCLIDYLWQYGWRVY